MSVAIINLLRTDEKKVHQMLVLARWQNYSVILGIIPECGILECNMTVPVDVRSKEYIEVDENSSNIKFITGFWLTRNYSPYLQVERRQPQKNAVKLWSRGYFYPQTW